MSKPNSIGEQPKSNSLLSTIADISRDGVFHGNYKDSTKQPLDHQQVLAALGDKIGRVNVSPNNAVQDVNMLVSASIYHAFLDFKNSSGDDQEKYEEFLNHWKFIAKKIQEISGSIPLALSSIHGTSPINGYMFWLGSILESGPIQTIIDKSYLQEGKDDFMQLMQKVILEMDQVSLPLDSGKSHTLDLNTGVQKSVGEIVGDKNRRRKGNSSFKDGVSSTAMKILAQIGVLGPRKPSSSANTQHLLPE